MILKGKGLRNINEMSVLSPNTQRTGHKACPGAVQTAIARGGHEAFGSLGPVGSERALFLTFFLQPQPEHCSDTPFHERGMTPTKERQQELTQGQPQGKLHEPCALCYWKAREAICFHINPNTKQPTSHPSKWELYLLSMQLRIQGKL